MLFEDLLIAYHRLISQLPSEEVESDPTFLSIAGLDYNENAISNIYAYFLNPDEKHGLEQAFLKALDQLTDEDILMGSWVVHREYPTEKGGRIDIVLEEDTNEPDKRVIIIENKLLHTVDNDLEDYYHTFKGQNKIAFLLSLEPVACPNYFKCITHKELILNVTEVIGPSICEVPSKYYSKAIDFIQHIKSLYEKMEDKEYEFIYNEGKNIERLTQLRDDVFYDLQSQFQKGLIDTCCEYNRLSGWSLSCKTEGETFIMYFILTDIFNEHRFQVDLWIKGSDNVKKWGKWDFNQSVKDYARSHSIDLIDTKAEKKEWAKTATKKYEVKSFEELKSFTSLVNQIIKNDWEKLITEFEDNFSLKK
ncbi:PD-(D/E)XK nuclease family protein [Ekhidna sp.]|uniref:PD-(D/E)XK nuclease family protein n=1 Tax=Ekhidna sp. TaxID=2608089 RepID=UPI003B5CF940